MSKKEKTFKGVSFKDSLIEAIEEFIEQHPEAGYKSVADFASEAVRLRIQEVKQLYPTRRQPSSSSDNQQ